MYRMQSARICGAAVLLAAAAGVQAQYETIKLVSDSPDTDEYFGASIAAEGDLVAIGAPDGRVGGVRTGVVYLFQNEGRGWLQIARIAAPDGSASDSFGRVALSDHTLLVGVYGDDDLGESAGAAWIFDEADGVWTPTAKLTASDGEEDEYFGSAVAIEGDVAVVGSPWSGPGLDHIGAAYVFEKIDGVWTEVAKLSVSDGSEESDFGGSVSLSNGVLLVGAPYADRPGGPYGAAYFFEKVGGIWTETAKIDPGDVGDRVRGFGLSVSLSGDGAIVGAPWSWDPGGYAYVYQRTDGVWSEIEQLTNSNPQEEDEFGECVAIEGGLAAVGDWLDDYVDATSGSVTVYRQGGSGWEPVAKLPPPDPSKYQHFGDSLAISGDLVFASAGLRWPPQAEEAVWVFSFAPCAVDFNGDFRADTRDVIAFLNSWAAGDSRADWDQNGTTDTQDVLAFLGDWVAGC